VEVVVEGANGDEVDCEKVFFVEVVVDPNAGVEEPNVVEVEDPNVFVAFEEPNGALVVLEDPKAGVVEVEAAEPNTGALDSLEPKDVAVEAPNSEDDVEDVVEPKVLALDCCVVVDVDPNNGALEEGVAVEPNEGALVVAVGAPKGVEEEAPNVVGCVEVVEAPNNGAEDEEAPKVEVCVVEEVVADPKGGALELEVANEGVEAKGEASEVGAPNAGVMLLLEA
jgi:hypothetical protein